MSMNCPKCGKKAICLDSRRQSDSTRRRYECTAKHKLRWTTIEMVVNFGRLDVGSGMAHIERKFKERAREQIREEFAQLLGMSS